MEPWKFHLLISTFSLIFGRCCCSNRTGNGESRIFNGIATRAGDMRFMGGLAKISARSKISDMSCTAFLIASQWVLTAGHCYKPNIAYKFIILVPPEQGNILEANVKKWNFHPDFNRTTHLPKHADFALLYLENGFAGIEFLKIASPNQDRLDLWQTRPFRGLTLAIAGFGLSGKNGTRPKALHKTYVNVINRCKEIKGVDETRAFCHTTGPVGEGHCPGDSGSPIILEAAYSKLALGVHTSGDSACRTEARPWGNEGINVRIAYYFRWIKKTMCAQDGSLLPYYNYVC